MSEPLTKSYVNTHDPEHPVQEDLVLYQLFEKARKEGNDGELVNLETMERMTASQIYDKADGYAKGLLALGLTPGEDTLTVVGVPTLEAACMFTAATSIGIGYAHPYIYSPVTFAISKVLPILESKVLVAGEGSEGNIFTALLSLFDENLEAPSSSVLPDVKHVFYDNSYKDRSPTQKFINNLDKLRQYGESISDQQLEEARKSVKPDHVLHHFFSSGSTGKPKCIVHSHNGMANELLLATAEKDMGVILAVNPNIDDLIGYSCLSLFLVRSFNKVVFSPDLIDEVSVLEKFGNCCSASLASERIDYLILPSGMQQLVAASLKQQQIQSPPLKLALFGGQLISREYKENIKKLFQVAIPFTSYGMSELSFIGYTPLGDKPSDLELMLNARICTKLNTEVRLVDENNELVDIGKDGEIQVKTFSTLKCYKDEPEKTKAAFTEDGFFKTGDVGTMHPDGTFIIKGRTADAIRFKIFGDVVYPGPIEKIVSKYPGIKNALVVGAKINDLIGDEITYCIRMHDGEKEPTDEELLEFCAQNGLDEIQRAARIIYLDSFPLTANGRKFSKKLLKQKVEEMLEKDSNVGMTKWFQDLNKEIYQII